MKLKLLMYSTVGEGSDKGEHEGAYDGNNERKGDNAGKGADASKGDNILKIH